MRRVRNAKGQDKALDELYKRYESRGITYDHSPEYAEQKSREISARTTAPKSYKMSAGVAADLKKYKNGVAGARRYMTDGDFADYYKASREYAPTSNVELETTILLQKVNKTKRNDSNIKMKNEKNDIKKKLKAEADKNNPKDLWRIRNEMNKSSEAKKKAAPKSKPITSEEIKKVAKDAVKTWIPIEERHSEQIVEGKKTKIPTGVILAILVITLSLLMIVGSAVLLGAAQREQNDLKDEIENLDFQIGELNTELNKKNEKIDIEFYAEEVLGMINQEHVNAEYINSNKTDGVEKHQNEKVSLASLIEWILQNLK